MNKRIAAIDIGSHSILLTIVEKDLKQHPPFKILCEQIGMTGLARGLHETNFISEQSANRSLQVLHKYHDLIEQHRVQNCCVVATEALRLAKNGADFKQKAEKILKHSIEIISGDREAELSFWSVQKEFLPKESQKVVFDIGGASTEISIGSSQGIEQKESLKIGSVILSEKFGLQSVSESTKALSYVLSILENRPWKLLPSLGIGVAGTITTLLALEMNLTEYKRASVHKTELSTFRLKFWMEQILSMDLEARYRLPALPRNRADVFGGGLVIAYGLTQWFGWNKIYCMDSGVRFGLIYEMLGTQPK